MTLDIELFIEAVKSRPALYNTKIKEYADKNLKKKLWSELCREFVGKWDELDAKEKTEKSDELQKKWKNLRTCFRREYESQKNAASGTGAIKRRKYVYFDQLLFLLDSIENRITSHSMQHQDDRIEKGEKVEHEESEEMPINTRANPNARSRSRKTAPIQKSYEESLMEILKEKRNEEKEIDEDKYFLLSLLPSFKKFNEDQKFVARTQIMNVMRRVRMSGSLTTENFNVGSPTNTTSQAGGNSNCSTSSVQIFPTQQDPCYNNHTHQSAYSAANLFSTFLREDDRFNLNQLRVNDEDSEQSSILTL